MPGPCAGIHVFLADIRLGVDGRDKPGHDELAAGAYFIGCIF
jgi:hypothetical protein